MHISILGPNLPESMYLGHDHQFQVLYLQLACSICSNVKFHKDWNTFQFWNRISHKNQAHCNFKTKSVQVLNFGSRCAISNIIFMINLLDLLRLPNFIELGIYFILRRKFPWNEGIDTCFNVKCVLPGCNFYFLGGNLVITARYLVITARYCSLLGGYWWIMLLTGGYCSISLVTACSHS